MDARELLAIAEAVVDEAERVFVARIGAAPEVTKPGGDFATLADIEIEQLLRQLLTLHTGIPVFGEEAGGDLYADAVWVVDPIDGTSNYSAGSPMCAILVALLLAGRPVVSVISMPLLGKRLCAFEGSPLMLNGRPQPQLAEQRPLVAPIAFGSIVSPVNSAFPTLLRHDLLAKVAECYPRLRVTGSVGVDLAFTALGIFAGAVTFSPFVWDNAAGVLAIEAAGGCVTDLQGNRWQPGSLGLVAGTRAVHESILGTIRALET
ncbi:inositol monophosphatase family protein [Corynebacterium sp.]|uniref:inositol monophosphatase family protein n=1 Tax=Corynebacterium sp. TaxID=1720 RepID=UPI0026DDC2D0|nr:inositol monophosphatase family protein [Corynebacterium sp.]MDO5075870.1 inositol monophosphatase family protein [Corynebacterium sp.]